MAQRHTSGPWEAVRSPTNGYDIVAPKAPKTYRRIARVGGRDRDANAALIKASTDLLEVAEWALAEAEGRTRYDNEEQRLACIEQVRAAIDLATGTP